MIGGTTSRFREPNVVRPVKRRSARTLSLRGGPTNSRHRSDQLATLDVGCEIRVAYLQTAAEPSLRDVLPAFVALTTNGSLRETSSRSKRGDIEAECVDARPKVRITSRLS
jgi:hypothetical protein